MSNQLATVCAKVKEMRAAQKGYFRTREFTALMLSKKLERDVDKMIKAIEANLVPQEQGRIA